MLTNAQLEQARDVLERRIGLVALWLFGSEARGTAGAGSDLDLAALFRSAPAAEDLLDAQAELTELLGTEVDLVDLERASAALAMQVLRHGRLFVDREPKRRARFVAAVPGRYEDLRIVRAPIERRIKERLHGRT